MSYRVGFYGDKDFSIAFYLDTVKEIFDSFSDDNSYSINDILELYSCVLILETGARHRKWSDSEYELLNKTKERVKAYVSKYFNSITDEILLDIINQIETKYIELFWKLFETYRLFERIHDDTIDRVINSTDTPLYPIMLQKKTVHQYDRIIANVLRKEPEVAARYLMDKYLKAESVPYYIPISFKTDEFEKAFLAYIKSDNPNPNYLELLVNGITSKECPISNDVKFAASEVLDEVLKRLFSNKEATSKWSITVGFGDNDSSKKRVKPILKEELNGFDVTYTFDINWLENSLNYESVLFTIIYGSQLVDRMMHCRLVSRPGLYSVFEDAFGVKGKTDYKKGTAFNFDNTASELILITYCDYLKNKGIEIEEFIKWYFSDYISNLYGVLGFEYNPSSPGTTYLEKNRNMAAELESIVKQWNLLVKDGAINRKKLIMAVDPVNYSTILSYIQQKYAKVVSDDLKGIEKALYSDQSLLNYYPVTKKGYDSFVELITLENSKISEFELYQQNPIKELIDKGFLYLTDEGYVKHDIRRFAWLAEDYHNGIIPYYNLDLKYSGLTPVIKETMKPFIENGDIIFEDNLLSSLESDYYDYHLNSKQFGNGLKMKNRYSHGNTSSNEDVQKSIYYKYVKLFLLLIVKINDELWNHYDD